LARLVLVSNRVSIPSGDGAKRAGGLEVALRPALERNGGVWFGWSGKAVPPADVEMHTVHHKNVTYVVTDLSEDDYQEYYNGFANRVLWPILHFRLDLAEFARRDLSGYMRVNERAPMRRAAVPARRGFGRISWVPARPKPTPPAPPRKSSQGLVWPPHCREVLGVPFAIGGAEHLRGAFKAPAPSPAPSPAPPKRK
jgi:Glycosyltransferase family 20